MEFYSKHHSFDVSIAQEVGIEKALLIHHLQHWISFNKNLGKNFKENRHWTYQTRKEIAAHLPYMSVDSVRHHLEELEAMGIIITGNFNKSPMDKTLWYAFADEEKFVEKTKIQKKFTKGENPKWRGENPKPIPDTKTNTCKEKLQQKEREEPKNLRKVVVVSFECKFFTDVELQLMAEKYGKERLKKVCEHVEKNEESIENPKGWAISALKGKWDIPENGPSKLENRIKQVKQYFESHPKKEALKRAVKEGHINLTEKYIEFPKILNGDNFIDFTQKGALEKIDTKIERILRKYNDNNENI